MGAIMKRWVIGVFGGACLSCALLGTAQAGLSKETYFALDLLGEAFERITADYVREVDPLKIAKSAIEGMASALDQQSEYIDAQEYKSMKEWTRGDAASAALCITEEFGLVKVRSSIGNGSTVQGVLPGDYISEIDGQSIRGLPLFQVIDRLHGPAESVVKLTILRRGEKKPVTVSVIRASARTNSFIYEKRGDFGYIRISTFDENTDRRLEKAINDLKNGAAVKGFVLDLRNNPGGLLEQALRVADDFLESGDIVTLRGRNANDNQTYHAKSGDIAAGKPIVVLIDGGSAGASQIVAGALQDNQRATVVGQRSFGDGTIQTMIPMNGGLSGVLKLTTAEYSLPSGRKIAPDGIVPDIAVSQSPSGGQTIMENEADFRAASEKPELSRDGKPTIYPDDKKSSGDFQFTVALEKLGSL